MSTHAKWGETMRIRNHRVTIDGEEALKTVRELTATLVAGVAISVAFVAVLGAITAVGWLVFMLGGAPTNLPVGRYFVVGLLLTFLASGPLFIAVSHVDIEEVVDDG